MNTILKLEHIQKYYGNEGNITKAIKDISFSVEAGEFLGIMGASGSGKTTLLNCISTIDTVSAGHIFFRGNRYNGNQPKIPCPLSQREFRFCISRLQFAGYIDNFRKHCTGISNQ